MSSHPSRPALIGKLLLVALLVAAVIIVPAMRRTTEASATAPGTVNTAPARPSAGCGTSTQGPVVEEQRTIDVNGTERWYLLTVPGAHDGTTPRPLVLDFHGLAEGAQVHTKMSEYSALAATEGFVVAFPQGRFNPVRWDASATSNPNEDLAFVDAMLDQIGAAQCIDNARVYATGLSYGAIFTSLLTCARSDRFAAVAPVAGVQRPTVCQQSRKVPMVAFHGTADPILPFNGGVGSIPPDPSTTLPPMDLNGPGYPQNVADWAASNGCDPAPVDTNISPEVIHRVYTCPDDAVVEFYVVIGGGHAWPGSALSRAAASVVGYTTFDIHASAVSWAFFQRFALPCAPPSVCAVTGTTQPPGSLVTTTSTIVAATKPAAAVPATPAFTG